MRFRERASSTRFRCVVDDLEVNQQQFDRVDSTTAQASQQLLQRVLLHGIAAKEASKPGATRLGNFYR